MPKKVRIGILGAAGIAKMAVVPAMISSQNALPVALATRDPAAAESWAKETGIRKLYDSYEALLADPEIDAVYIPLPNSAHRHWAKQAAVAGKAVLCEKPLAVTAAEAQEIVDFCHNNNVPVMEGFMYQFHPQHALVDELIAKQTIGEVVEVQAHLSVDLMNPSDPANVRFNKRLGGGALLDMGCYVVHICRRIFGEEPSRVTAQWVIDETHDVDIATRGILEFSGDRAALISCSFKGNGQGYYRVVGRKGVIDVPRGILPGLDERIAETVVSVIDDKGQREEHRLDPVDQYRLMIEAFCDAVLNGRPTPVEPQDAIFNLQVLEALAKSARTGCAVNV